MAIKSRNTLKTYFETGDKPTQDEYGDLIDSMVHPDEDAAMFGVGVYNATKLYELNSYCFFEGNIYICIEQTSGTFDPEKWQKINNNDIVAIVDITHSELLTAINESSLIPGMKYRITDFRTIHIIPNTDVINEGNSEPLIVFALKNNVISSQVKSEVYPQDIIHYDINNVLCEDNITARPGWIYRRIDTSKNITACYDWRNVKYRRWKFDFSDLEWDDETTYYFGEVCAKNEILYVLTSSESTNEDPEGISSWVTAFPNGYYLPNVGDFITIAGIEASYVLKAKADSYKDNFTFKGMSEPGAMYENIAIEAMVGTSQPLSNVVIFERATNVKIQSENLTANTLNYYTDIGCRDTIVLEAHNSKIEKQAGSTYEFEKIIITSITDTSIINNGNIINSILYQLRNVNIDTSIIDSSIILNAYNTNINYSYLANTKINTTEDCDFSYNNVSQTMFWGTVMGKIENVSIIGCFFTDSTNINISNCTITGSTIEVWTSTLSNVLLQDSVITISNTTIQYCSFAVLYGFINLGTFEKAVGFNLTVTNLDGSYICGYAFFDTFIQCEYSSLIGFNYNNYIQESFINLKETTIRGIMVESNLSIQNATINHCIFNKVTIVNNISIITAIANNTGDAQLFYFSITAGDIQQTDMEVSIPDGTSAEDAADIIASELESLTSGLLEFDVEGADVIVYYRYDTPGFGDLEVSCTDPLITTVNTQNSHSDLNGTIFSATLDNYNLCRATKLYDYYNKEVIKTNESSVKIKSFSDTGITLNEITD